MASDIQRKLTTILAADAEGYSREMEADEVRTLGALRAARAVFTKMIESHRGRIANTAGDGLIAEFPSAVEAVRCAVEVQRELGSLTDIGALRFRIGIHLGDVLVDGDDLLGEGVNLAARLQTMAEPGGVLISQQVYDQVQKKLSIGFEYLGDKRPKNFAEDVAVYRIAGGEDGQPLPRPRPLAAPVDPGLRDKVKRNALILGALAGLLVLANLATGGAAWAHWIILIMAAWLAWKAAPLFAQGTPLKWLRTAISIVLLALVNIFTWDGNPWFLWIAGIIIFVTLMRSLKR